MITRVPQHKKAFTLIELLIVVAIIGILAAIVVPNFITALIKARVARSQADINAISNSVLTYRVDHNLLPPLVLPDGSTRAIIRPQHLKHLFYLTTPIAYINAGSVKSPFSEDHGYWYYNWEFFREEIGRPRIFYWNNLQNAEPTLWMISTIGPNGIQFPYETLEGNLLMFHEYNPSNGVVSGGIIQEHGI